MNKFLFPNFPSKNFNIKFFYSSVTENDFLAKLGRFKLHQIYITFIKGIDNRENESRDI